MIALAGSRLEKLNLLGIGHETILGEHGKTESMPENVEAFLLI